MMASGLALRWRHRFGTSAPGLARSRVNRPDPLVGLAIVTAARHSGQSPHLRGTPEAGWGLEREEA
jgi:hypothetical protein